MQLRLTNSQRYLVVGLVRVGRVSRVRVPAGKSSESVQCAMLKACDACTDMGQL